jgi:CheY-like chemotaxis protein
MAAQRILIVDDHPTNLKLIRVVLEGEGYEVRTASDADEALAVLPEFQPKLILMDIQLPGMDGLELTRLIKSQPGGDQLRIVALTAYAMKGDEERIRNAGCDGYIAKPIDTRSLGSIVAGYFDATA